MKAKTNNIKLECGFAAKVDENALQDIRLISVILDWNKSTRIEQVQKIGGVLELFLGKEQLDKLYEYLIEKEGRPVVDTCEHIIGELIEGLSERKKKS